MSSWYEWVFDGIGTSILTGILGLLLGGISGYKIGVKITTTKKKMIQKTKGDGTRPIQIGDINGK